MQELPTHSLCLALYALAVFGGLDCTTRARAPWRAANRSTSLTSGFIVFMIMALMMMVKVMMAATAAAASTTLGGNEWQRPVATTAVAVEVMS